MGWTYSNWRSQSRAAAQLTSLKLHLQEVADAIGREVDSDGKRVSSQAVQQYHASLVSELEKRQTPGSIGAVNGGMSYASFKREPR